MTFQESLYEICKGNPDALAFCNSYYEAVHAIDDLIDRDKPVDQRAASVAILRLLHVMAFNPFLQAHRDKLWPVIQSSCVTYIHSNDLIARKDPRSTLIGEVLKGDYVNVFLTVASLAGGIEHQLRCQDQFRTVVFG